MSSRRTSSGARTSKDATRMRIEKMEAEREERRRLMQERKQERSAEDRRNKEAGTTGDVDFISLVRKWRDVHCDDAQSHETMRQHPKICICVRKRPIQAKEKAKHDHDCVTCLHPQVWVHHSKLRVDGITKYLDHNSFRFDHAFDENSTTDQIYHHSTRPLVDFVCNGTGGRATVFAYGQTGSGKTYTMQGIQEMVAEDLYMLLATGECGCSVGNTIVTVAFFEIYGGFVQDLLNDRKRLKVLEDGKGEIVVTGLGEFEAHDAAQFLKMVESGNDSRTTHATEANDASSRSHAICQIFLREKSSSKLRGKLSLVDLAGSERGSDTRAHNSQRRNESAEINTSLLSLKECIRALDNKNTHVPYRASKLTLILKDCFTSKQARTSMIATVSPGSSSADHTLNTLRYADRIKEKKVSNNNSSSKTLKTPPSTATTSTTARSSSVPKPKERLSEEKSTSKKTKASATKPVQQQRLKQQQLVQDEEAQLRQIVQALFEQEEALLHTHMTTIQENADLLTEEGRMIHAVQGDDVTDQEMDAYAKRLTEILERKTQLIESLQAKMFDFRSNLRQEEELSKRVGSLSQY